MQRRSTPSECPVCGASVPPGAKACPECGADERSGWDEEATRLDGLDLPYAEDEEAGARNKGQLRWLFWSLVAFLLIAALLWLFVRGPN